MNSKTIFRLTCLLTCSLVAAPSLAMDAEKQPLDVAEFRLPGTPANEVRFEEPREIREVIVTLKSAAPEGLGLSYLHKTWRRKRQELLDPTIGNFQLGWKVVDDWFDVAWDKGAVRVEKTGAHRFFFGLGRWSRVANYADPAPALIYHVERRNGDLRVHQESFAVPLLKPVGEDLAGDDPTVCLVRFMLRNEGLLPITATLPIEFSSRSRGWENTGSCPWADRRT